MSIIDKISRKSVQDSRLFQEEKLRIPSEFTRFERSLPLKIKMHIILLVIVFILKNLILIILDGE